MKQLTKIGLFQLLQYYKDEILYISSKYGFDTYDTCLYWPYFYIDNLIDVWQCDSVLLCSFKLEIRDIYYWPHWIVPYKDCKDQICKDIYYLTKKLGSLYYLPEVVFTIFNLYGQKKLMFPDYVCETETIISMNRKVLKRKKSGIIRYKGNTCYEKIYWPFHDKKKANAFYYIWKNKKFEKNNKLLIEDIAYLQLINTDNDLISLCNLSVGYFISYENRYIAFAWGAPISQKRWSMIVRLVDYKYQYLSDYIFNDLAFSFKSYIYESDGTAYGIDEESLARYKKGYATLPLSVNLYSFSLIVR